MTIAELRSHHSSHSLPSLKEQNTVYGNIPKYFVISLYMSFKGQDGLEWVRSVCVMGWVNFLTQHLKDILSVRTGEYFLYSLPDQSQLKPAYLHHDIMHHSLIMFVMLKMPEGVKILHPYCRVKQPILCYIQPSTQENNSL